MLPFHHPVRRETEARGSLHRVSAVRRAVENHRVVLVGTHYGFEKRRVTDRNDPAWPEKYPAHSRAIHPIGAGLRGCEREKGRGLIASESEVELSERLGAERKRDGRRNGDEDAITGAWLQGGLNDCSPSRLHAPITELAGKIHREIGVGHRGARPQGNRHAAAIASPDHCSPKGDFHVIPDDDLEGPAIAERRGSVISYDGGDRIR